MKNILMVAIAAFLASATSSSIGKLWAELETARKADRPADEAAILEKIKDQASKEGLLWDWYRASNEYINVKSRTNWKNYDPLRKEMDAAVESYGEPVMVFYRKSGNQEFARANEAGLKAGSHVEFWENDTRIARFAYKKAIVKALGSDWDYACYASGIKENFDGRYPLDAFIEFEGTTQKDLQAYAGKYAGKAVSLLARQQLLQARLYSENEDYVKLKADCEQFEKERKSFRGDEALIAGACTIVEGVLETLDSKAVFPTISKDLIVIGFRNVGSAPMVIRSGKKTVWKGTVMNSVRSLYRIDTVKVGLPRLPDGDYEFVCAEGEKYESSGTYSQHTLSLSARTNADGTGIFATDFISGEPLREAEVLLYDRNGVLKGSAAATLNDGYTPLPKAITDKIADGKNYAIAVRSGDRLSRNVTIYSTTQEQNLNDRQDSHCIILTDRAAYTPDETMEFKCIVYEGTYRIHPSAYMPLKYRLYDAEGAEIGSGTLKTNDFGSAAGRLPLTRGKRGGTYNLMVEDGKGQLMASRTVRVDDFVLPTFDVRFEKGDEDIEGPVDSISIRGSALAYSGHSLGAAKMTYSVMRNGSEIAASPVLTGSDGSFSFSFPVVKEEEQPYYDYYDIKVNVTDGTGETLEFRKSVIIRRKQEPAPKPVEHFFEEIEGDGIALRVVSTMKDTWAVAELYGSGNVLLDSRLVKFTGETTLRYEYKASYPDAVTLNVIYFQDRKTHSHSLRKRREDHRLDLPVSFSRFLDTTVPGTGYTFSVKTGAGVECAAAVFDKSTETVRPNEWTAIKAVDLPFPNIRVANKCGDDSSRGGYGNSIRVRGMSMAQSKAAMADGVTEEAIPFQLVETHASFSANGAATVEGDGYIRENFANTIAWEPFLKSDADGNVSFNFTTSDKLSTYWVQIFAHDRNMRNAVLRQEMKVTIPVKIAIVEPRFLYEGDRLVIRATVSNATDSSIGGTVSFNGGSATHVIVPAKGATAAEFRLNADYVGDFPLKVVFKADNESFGSDGVKVIIPIKKAAQTLTEAHSALLKAGADRNALIASLRSKFENIPGSEVAVKEVSILDMINEALPAEVEPKGENTISLARAILARKLIGQDYSELLEKLQSKRGPNGGYVWFDGMDESPIVTSVVLELLQGILPDCGKAVAYLDKAYAVGRTTPYWCQWITTAQYLYVRSLYPGFSFNEVLEKERRKEVKEYLCPGKERGLNGVVFIKARRAATLRNLTASEDGIAFAKKLGISLFTSSRLSKSEEKDIESLSQYAVGHSSGGYYFPNAVMPWRGLLESELYAHVFLSRLFEGTEIADGIRLWFMVQKETQQWDNDPAYILALKSVLEGSDELKRTRVIALSGEFTKPFSEVKAAGNGFTINEEALHNLKVGDKVTLKCKAWSEENRSFVKLTLPFPAGMIPANQNSGYCSWRCYRSVLKDRIEYWFDTFPEENRTISEEFYVQRAGAFQCPAAEIVCNYADHYRANSAAVGITEVAE